MHAHEHYIHDVFQFYPWFICYSPFFETHYYTYKIKPQQAQRALKHSNVKALNNLFFFFRFLTSLLEDGKRNTWHCGTVKECIWGEKIFRGLWLSATKRKLPNRKFFCYITFCSSCFVKMKKGLLFLFVFFFFMSTNTSGNKVTDKFCQSQADVSW